MPSSWLKFIGRSYPVRKDGIGPFHFRVVSFSQKASMMTSDEVTLAALFLRCSVFFATFPFLRNLLSPSLIGVLSGAFTIALFPGGVESGEPLVVLSREALLGFCLAFPVALALEQLNMIGRGVDVVRGAQGAEVMFAQERHSLLEGYFSVVGGIWLTVGGGYQRIYTVLSTPVFIEAEIPRIVVDYLSDGVRLLAPLFFLSILFELGVGLLARALNGVPLSGEMSALRLVGGFFLGGVTVANLFIELFQQ